MGKFYISSASMVMADGKEHTLEPVDMNEVFNASVDVSTVRGGVGKELLDKLKDSYEKELDSTIKL